MGTAFIFDRKAVITLCLLFMYCVTSAQDYLGKVVSVTASRQPLREALQAAADQGGFYFSYNSSIIPEDSLVSFSVEQKTVRYLLGLLFSDRYQYKTSGNYVIIQYPATGNAYTVSGYIEDAVTGEGVSDASVYERQQLAVTFTDKQGYFRLKLKDRYAQVAVNISKMDYGDTAVYIRPGLNQELHVAIQPAPVALKGVTIAGATERSWLSNLFLSARQKKQSMNLREFFAHKPYQFSLIPGISTRGKLNSQVINRFSLNVVGGYTAGSRGFEIGGLFNINQLSTHSLQLAGGLNVTEGSAGGVQVAGLHNLVLDTMKGVQLSALSNKVEAVASGVQIAGVYNYAKRLKGLQIGIINRTDSLGGISFGALNFVRGGYRRVSFTANDLTTTNLSFMTGNKNLYSILIIGANTIPSEKLFVVGGGFGHDFLLGKRLSFSVQANYQFVKILTFDNRLTQYKGLANIAIGKNLWLSAGPVFHWYSNYDKPREGYKHVISPEDYEAAYPRRVRTHWTGWEAGLVFETARARTSTRETKTRTARGWRLGVGLEGGYAFDFPDGVATGGSVQLQKDFTSNISAVMTAGYTHVSINTEYYPISAFDFIPLKAGLKVFAHRHIYFGALAGIAWEVNGLQASTFVWSPAVGLALPSGFDISLKMDDFTKKTATKLAALNIVYQFKL
jgi:hypothetical protein